MKNILNKIPFVVSAVLLIVSGVYLNNGNHSEAKAYFLIAIVPVVGFVLQWSYKRLTPLKK